ncbi:hypothetical protein HanPSC8_Chr04g0174631 [Helianthus annuus]|nr:hypothetical protein HanPSC8_Chr04g0174631 [Helianthus annuus]
MKKWQNRDNIFLHPSNNPHKRPPRLSRVPDMVCVCVYGGGDLYGQRWRRRDPNMVCVRLRLQIIYARSVNNL